MLAHERHQDIDFQALWAYLVPRWIEPMPNLTG
jgi:hypothetical protein